MRRRESHTCRVCGYHYLTGEYRDHTHGMQHQRELRLQRLMRRRKVAAA